MGWTVPYSNPDRSKRVSLLQNIQTGSGDHPASYAMGTGFRSWDEVVGSVKLIIYF
jgi:hypothetical protein